MHENLLSIKIHCPVEKLFEFTVNPQNTHLWIDFISWETIDTDVPKLWSIYSNGGGEYKCVEFTENERFHLKSINADYEVIYLYNRIDAESSIVNYYEYMTDGSNLMSPFSQKHLQKLKILLE